MSQKNGSPAGPNDLFWPVAIRAEGRCEYCDWDGCTDPRILASSRQDHIVPKKSEGEHSTSNLALSCCWCNATKHKWDPTKGETVPLTREQLVEKVAAHIKNRQPEYYIKLIETIKGGKIAATAKSSA